MGGNVEKGKKIAFEHPYVNCIICHRITKDGELIGSEMGPVLDGIAGSKEPDYILESLLQPNAKITEGYSHFQSASPMPPLASILSKQEISDLMAYLITLK